jgi:hypothetical protein
MITIKLPRSGKLARDGFVARASRDPEVLRPEAKGFRNLLGCRVGKWDDDDCWVKQFTKVDGAIQRVGKYI